jgi:hypothetical protein
VMTTGCHPDLDIAGMISDHLGTRNPGMASPRASPLSP